jgi:putative transposase
MTDENDTNSNTAAASTDASATTPAPKKQRVPRRPKAATEMMGGLAVAKFPRGPQKRSSAEKATLASAEAPVASKRKAKGDLKVDGRKRRTKRVEQPIATTVTAIEEMADLIELEEENKRLRQTLAEKLRAENADLRKRLGLD